MIAFAVFFLITLGSASMASWERILYYVLAIALILIVAYDIVCTCSRRQKYIAGFILYGITLAVIILSLVVMALNSANGRLLIDISERFWRIIFFSYLINAFAILIYCTGEKLITNITNRAKK
jgi:hypothetical protein